MLVRQILFSKPSRSVLYVSPDAPVSQAVEKLSANQIGALLVFSSNETLEGVISERDIVREIGRVGPEALMHVVRDLMTTDVIACNPSDAAVDVLEKMTSGRFRHMPVVEKGKVIGVISIGDVVKARIDEVEHENSALTEMISGYA